jgi:hypothetical protein
VPIASAPIQRLLWSSTDVLIHRFGISQAFEEVPSESAELWSVIRIADIEKPLLSPLALKNLLTFAVMAVVNVCRHFLSHAITSRVRWPQIHSEPLHAFRLRPR